MKLMRETASLVNWMMANPNFHKPEVGEDVTELMWTDRSAWRVTEVDPDGKGATLTRYAAKFIGQGYGDERYCYEDENGCPLLNENHKIHIRYRYKSWRVNGKHKIHLAWGCRDEYQDPSF